jgi:hypothetical protein
MLPGRFHFFEFSPEILDAVMSLSWLVHLKVDTSKGMTDEFSRRTTEQLANKDCY